jgi:hypothetical protein
LDTPAIPEADYLTTASQAGLSNLLARQSWDLYQTTPFDLTPTQTELNLVLAYQHAHSLAASFQDALQKFGEAHNVAVRFRPSTVKDANRSIEKMRTKPTVIPADLLAGTVIAANLAEMYSLTVALHSSFRVVSFRDRMMERLPSGYGDLQCLVDLGGHLAELKIVHRLFQDIDRHEHRLYEILRSLEAAFPDKLPLGERIVVEALSQASRQMYTEAWKAIMATEGGHR